MTLDGGGAALLVLARAAITDRFETPSDAFAPDVERWLSEPGATFVTLTQSGQLRGCIGSLMAHRPLREDVVSNARSAAFRDPRFSPLTSDELDRTHVEVSLLSSPEPVEFGSEDEARRSLRPGVDGAILSAPGHRGTFLPQVWEQLPDPDDFWSHLKRKAGLPAGYWSADARLERYTVTAWHEDRT